MLLFDEALLAFTPDQAVADLRSMTGETITDPAVLTAQLDQIRTTGIATEDEEAVLGECASAATGFRRLGGVRGSHRVAGYRASTIAFFNASACVPNTAWTLVPTSMTPAAPRLFNRA